MNYYKLSYELLTFNIELINPLLFIVPQPSSTFWMSPLLLLFLVLFGGWGFPSDNVPSL